MNGFLPMVRWTETRREVRPLSSCFSSKVSRVKLRLIGREGICGSWSGAVAREKEPLFVLRAGICFQRISFFRNYSLISANVQAAILPVSIRSIWAISAW